MPTRQNKHVLTIPLIIVLAFVVIVIAIFALPWLFMAVASVFSPLPPKPPVDYAEFPFKLVYEINDEVKTIEDTLIIEHNGYTYHGTPQKRNSWRRSLKSGNSLDSLTLFHEDYVPDGGSVTIRFELGSCEYYMGLEEANVSYIAIGAKPGDIIESRYRFTGAISEEELYEKYNIRIIDMELSSPLSSSDQKQLPPLESPARWVTSTKSQQAVFIFNLSCPH